MRVLIGVGVGAPAQGGTPLFKVAQEENEPRQHVLAAVGGWLLDELARDGTR